MHLVQIGGDESAESSDVISRFEQVWHHHGHDAGSAAEVLQMRLRMLAFAVGRVEEQRRRWPCASKWPLIADIGPQPAGFGPPSSGGCSRDWAAYRTELSTTTRR